MSTFTQDDGFYQGNYDQQQSLGFDMAEGQQFGGEQQFAQFDYSQNAAGYGDNSNYYSPGQSPYVGSILTPDSSSQYAQATDNYEDEPPLMEELGINFDHIMQKTMTVLNPVKTADHTIMQDTDLAGPLVFCLAFGGSLLLSGKLHFGYIYGIGVVGCLAMYCLLNLMSMTGVSASCIVSVLGYCLLPMIALSFSSVLISLHITGVSASCIVSVLGFFLLPMIAFSFSSVLISLQGVPGIALTSITVLWCSLSASKLFVSALAMDQQQLLVAYPCALVYGVFALITVF